MTMNLSPDDIESFVEKFHNCIHKQNGQKILEADMWSIIDTLTKELETSRENEKCLQNNFKKLFASENDDITTLVVVLREKLEKYEKENVRLNNQLNELQKLMVEQAEARKNEYQHNLENLQESHKNEVNYLKQQIENDKFLFEKREKELYNELQLCQASNALQCDEIESSLKRQLVDANNKLRNYQNVIRSLQSDINNLNNQLAGQKTRYNKTPKAEIRFDSLPIRSTKPCISYSESETEIFQIPYNRNVCNTPSGKSVTSNQCRPEDLETNFYRTNDISRNSGNYEHNISEPFGQPPNRDTDTPSRGFNYESRDFKVPQDSNVSSPSRSVTPLVRNRTQSKSNMPQVFKGINKCSTKSGTVLAANLPRRKRKLYDPDSIDQSNFPTF